MKQVARPLLSGLPLTIIFEKLRSDDVAFADQRRDDASLFARAARLGLYQHSGLARMQWKTQHLSPDRRHRARRVNRAEFREQTLGGFNRRLRRSLEPIEPAQVGDAGRVQFQRSLGQIGAMDFGNVVIAPGVEVLRGIKPQTPARPRPPGSPGSLRRRSLA